MNFLLLRSNQTAATEQSSVLETPALLNQNSKPPVTLEGLIAEDSFPTTSLANDFVGTSEEVGSENGGFGSLSAKDGSALVDKHIDVSEEEGWITIPCKELPGNWSEAPDMRSFRTLDRSFVFPGEHVHILACLSACKQDIEIITPFKVAEVMSKNGIGRTAKIENGNDGYESDSFSREAEVDRDKRHAHENAGDILKNDLKKDVSAGESLLRMEDYRRQTETLLQRFRNSHFFARIAESDEPLWSKRRSQEGFSEITHLVEEKFVADGSESRKSTNQKAPVNAAVDGGSFNAGFSGGLARNTIECTSLANGDIVMLLQVNIGVDFVKDPMIEILQFEKYQNANSSYENPENLIRPNQDPCRDLLKWLLPLDNSVPPLGRPSSPPPISSSSGIRSTSTRYNLSGSSGSQIFPFGHFRSYSMSSLPPNSTPTSSVATHNSKQSFDLEDWDRFTSQKFETSERSGNEGLLSFRGVPLEPERFSVRCGLEGIFVPGRRWRRKIEIIQPIEIHSFAADCNTEDLLCVQIMNVSPAHIPDIVVYLDAITIIFEAASKGGAPLSMPVACIEAGNNHSLPNLALRRGEEHSFILKPATSAWRSYVGQAEKNSQSLHILAGSSASDGHSLTNIDRNASPSDCYAVLVSCRCNYTESKLFFKQPTSWRPRILRDLLISVASQMSKKTLGSDERVPQLPVQILALQASNLTPEDLTLTVLAPASFTSPPSIVSLNSSPSSPISPFFTSDEKHGIALKSLSAASLASENQQQQVEESRPNAVSFSEHAIEISDVLPRSDQGCTHLWLQSRVLLGCVPSRSTATIKLELLPLTDGIITLDSLQIHVKEKGLNYVPEQTLKINATSSIATGIV